MTGRDRRGVPHPADWYPIAPWNWILARVPIQSMMVLQQQQETPPPKGPIMITIVILATIALVIVGVTIVSATRDGYRRTPARMWDSNLESQARAPRSPSPPRPAASAERLVRSAYGAVNPASTMSTTCWVTASACARGQHAQRPRRSAASRARAPTTRRGTPPLPAARRHQPGRDIFVERHRRAARTPCGPSARQHSDCRRCSDRAGTVNAVRNSPGLSSAKRT